jgi:hypothetical protein
MKPSYQLAMFPGLGWASQRLHNLWGNSIRITVCLQAHRKSQKKSPASAAAIPRIWVAQRFQRCENRDVMTSGQSVL